MQTVKELSELVGVSVRTLHHYDAIGLLRPSRITEAGYRLYNEEAAERLRLIVLCKELGFSLKEIASLLELPENRRDQALDIRIREMEHQRNALQDKIFLAKQIKTCGVNNLNLNQLKTDQMDDYEAQAKMLWGKTEAYREYETRAAKRSDQENKDVMNAVMDYFVRLGTLRDQAPESDVVQEWVADLRAYFTEHFYNCTPQILMGLGHMYVAGGSMTDNIDRAGGEGTAQLAHEAIVYYCKQI